MSRAFEYRYALEAAARRALEESRIRERVTQDIQRFISKYTRMKDRGYSAYIPDEMQQVQNEIKRVEQMLSSDFREARDLSHSLDNYIDAMDSLAESAAHQFHLSELQRAREAKEARSKLVDTYYQLVEKIENPIVVNFAQKDLNALLSELKSGKSEKTATDIEREIHEIVERSTIKAKEWKVKTKASQKKQIVRKKLDEKEQALLQSSIHGSEKSESILAQIRHLKDQMDNSTDQDINADESLAHIDEQIDDALITEDIRRETVRSIVHQLQQQEFNVSAPQLIGEGKESFVRITATKPSGKRAVCQIDMTGKIAYKFDQYEGMTCLKDIERFNSDLQEIYSIHLSDERVLWSNPDRLTKDAYSAVDEKRRTL